MPVTERTTTEVVSYHFDQVETYCHGGLEPDHRILFANVNSQHFKRTWTNTPDYLVLRRAKARLPDRGYTFERSRRATSRILYVKPQEVIPCGGPWDVHLRDLSYEKVPGSYVSQYLGEVRLNSNSVISQLLNRARAAEFNLPVFFGEARSTLNMVLSTAQTLARSFRRLRRGDVLGAYSSLGMTTPPRRSVNRFNRHYGRDAVRAASGRWLEMQYGWIPLLLEVKNAAEQLAEFGLDDDKTFGRVYARSQLRSVIDETAVVEVSPPGFARRVGTQQESFRATWIFQPTELNNLGSLGLLNPLTVAWELLPLSFVVDWMFPIGRYLESLDVPLRFNHKGGTLGYARTVSTSYTNFTRDGVNGVGTYESTFVKVTRDPFTSIPSLGLNSIFFDPNLGVRRTLSGLALASQRFLR